MQVRPASLNEKVPQLIGSFLNACSPGVGADGLAKGVDLILRKQIRHLPAAEQAVDVFEERFLDDLRVVEQEDGLLILRS
eukprot:760276-Rhodomonas_salina.1